MRAYHPIHSVCLLADAVRRAVCPTKLLHQVAAHLPGNVPLAREIKLIGDKNRSVSINPLAPSPILASEE